MICCRQAALPSHKVLRKRGGLGEKEEGRAIQEAAIKANRTKSGRAEPSRAERRFSAALKEFQPWQERCMEKERVGEQEKKVTCSGKKTSHHKWGDFQSWVMLVRKCSFYDSKEPRKTVILQPPHLDLPTVLFLFVFYIASLTLIFFCFIVWLSFFSGILMQSGPFWSGWNLKVNTSSSHGMQMWNTPDSPIFFLPFLSFQDYKTFLALRGFLRDPVKN